MAVTESHAAYISRIIIERADKDTRFRASPHSPIPWTSRSSLDGLIGTNHDALFVPFLDRTSGADTYGAGRYLDVEPEEDGTYTLDFNLAYHPSWAYSPDHACPLTPAENRLHERMEAGERLAVADPR